MLAIGVTEWGHLLALIALVPLLPGWRGSKMGRIAAVAGIAAALLSLTPLLRSIAVARSLPAQLNNAFGETPLLAGADSQAQSTPLSVRNLILGVPLPPVN
jgi:hypothetical protein